MLIHLLINAIVPVLDELTDLKLAGAHQLEFLGRLRVHLSDGFEHVLADAVVAILVLDVLWDLLVFITLDVHEVAEIPS